MSDKELEFEKKLKDLLDEYKATLTLEYGYYDEQTPYFSIKGGKCKISIPEYL